MKVQPDTILKFIKLVSQVASITEDQLDASFDAIVAKWDDESEEGGLEPNDLIQGAAILFILYLKDIGAAHG